MPQWHLDELLAALTKRGWRMVAQHAGNDYRVSATWELERNGGIDRIQLDFDGFDDMVCLPLDKAYGCSVRGTSNSVYFRRRGAKDSKARDRWRAELDQFVDALA